MLENIRNIGIFMIAAQAVVHFAPGKQYEKYIKSVSGIIILLLFLRPFLQISGAEWKEPEEVLEKLPELADIDTKAFDMAGTGVGHAVVSRMEEEVRELLNRELAGEDYRVKQVSLQFEQDSLQESEMVLSEVEVTVAGTTTAKEEGRIGVDEIVIGGTQEPAGEDVFPDYRKRFAALLGIEEEKVEVKSDGRG